MAFVNGGMDDKYLSWLEVYDTMMSRNILAGCCYNFYLLFAPTSRGVYRVNTTSVAVDDALGRARTRTAQLLSFFSAYGATCPVTDPKLFARACPSSLRQGICSPRLWILAAYHCAASKSRSCLRTMEDVCGDYEGVRG